MTRSIARRLRASWASCYAGNDAHERWEMEADVDEDEREGEGAAQRFKARTDGIIMKRIALRVAAYIHECRTRRWRDLLGKHSDQNLAYTVRLKECTVLVELEFRIGLIQTHASWIFICYSFYFNYYAIRQHIMYITQSHSKYSKNTKNKA